MVAAFLITAFAFSGLTCGVIFHRTVSHHWAAAGGIVLLAVALGLIVPEIAAPWGWPRALLITALAAFVLTGIDAVLTHLGHSPRHGVLAPLLAATALHSVLDGWSIRALGMHPLVALVVPVGLALHKLPEGFALGWVLRRVYSSHTRALTLGIAAESFTLLGAYLQPSTDHLGLSHFGPSWTTAVLSTIAGAFIFLGLHTLFPYLRQRTLSPDHSHH